jgi:hypothetical protein
MKQENGKVSEFKPSSLERAKILKNVINQLIQEDPWLTNRSALDKVNRLSWAALTLFIGISVESGIILSGIVRSIPNYTSIYPTTYTEKVGLTMARVCLVSLVGLMIKSARDKSINK